MTILNCTTGEDADAAIRGLEGLDAKLRTKPHLTPDFMATDGFQERVMDFLDSTRGNPFLNRILQKHCDPLR